jgi:hypothetical protein
MASKEKASPVDRRGQIQIELEGVAYGLRPSFAAIEVIEAQCRPLGELVAALNDHRLPIREMGIITAELMRAFGEAHPNDPNISTYRGAQARKLAELIYDEGTAKARVILFIVLAEAMGGGFTASGEAKPATETKATPGAGKQE